MTDKTVLLKYEPGLSKRLKWILTMGGQHIASFSDGPVQRRLAFTTAERLAKIQKGITSCEEVVRETIG